MASTNNDDNETKIAVLETKAEYIIRGMAEHERMDDDRFKEQSNHMSSIEAKIDEMKSRLDKQNGTLPHLVEAMQSLTTSLNELKALSIKTELKTGILWALSGALGSTLLLVIIKQLLHL